MDLTYEIHHIGTCKVIHDLLFMNENRNMRGYENDMMI